MTSTKEQRSWYVAQMRANFAQEGGTPDPEQEALLNEYIEGTASLADLFAHAHEYLGVAYKLEQDQEHDRKREQPQFDIESKLMHQLYDHSLKLYDEEQQQKNIVRREWHSEKRKRHEAIESARANVELSGFKVSEEHWQLALRYADGEITFDEFISKKSK